MYFLVGSFCTRHKCSRAEFEVRYPGKAGMGSVFRNTLDGEGKIPQLLLFCSMPRDDSSLGRRGHVRPPAVLLRVETETLVRSVPVNKDPVILVRRRVETLRHSRRAIFSHILKVRGGL